MSSEMKMKKGYVPELRFPEFRNDAEWELKLLGKVGKNLDSKRVPVTEKDRVKGNIPYYGASGIIDYINDFIFNEKLLCISEDGANLVIRNYPIAFSISGKTWVNNHAHVLKFKDISTQVLVENYLNSINLEDYLTGMAQPKLNRAKLDIIPIPLPNSENEQQKIADCLSSLDNVISLQTQKIDALQQYKKGLMQKLFPAEGETVPELRFSEFLNKPEWKLYNFCNLIEQIIDFRGRTPLKLGMEWGNGNIISLSANNVKNGYIDYNAECNLGSEDLYHKWMGKVNLEKGDIVFTMEAPLGNALLIPDERKYILSQRVVAFKTRKKINNKFFIQLIWGQHFQNTIRMLSTGSTAKGINQKSLNKIYVRVPSLAEQVKISECFSSLDDLITAETQKLAALKTHKTGLMQQLFPAMDEVNA